MLWYTCLVTVDQGNQLIDRYGPDLLRVLPDAA